MYMQLQFTILMWADPRNCGMSSYTYLCVRCLLFEGGGREEEETKEFAPPDDLLYTVSVVFMP